MSKLSLRNSGTLVWALVLIASVLFCTQAHADLVQVSISQDVNTTVSGDSDADGNSSLMMVYPPRSAMSSFGGNDASASQTFALSDITPPHTVPLTLSGTTAASTNSVNGTAESELIYRFTVTESHNYLLSSILVGSGSTVTLSQFSPMSGPLAAAGTLTTGITYELFARSFVSMASGGGLTNSSFTLAVTAVPEAPAWLALGSVSIGALGICLARRRLNLSPRQTSAS
jgi:hypothetical protein